MSSEKLPSIPGIRAGNGRISLQDQLIQTMASVELLCTRVTTVERDQSDSTKMLEHIHRTCADIASKVAELQAQIRDDMSDICRKLTEQRKDLQDICTIRHEALDKRFEHLEKSDDRVFGQVQEMGEITKVKYIQELQRQLQEEKSNRKTVEKRSFEWRKFWVAALVAVMSAIVSGYVVHRLTASSSIVVPAHK